MEFGQLCLQGDVLQFMSRGVSLALANALRRTLLAELPGFALHCGAFEHNDTGLSAVYLAHRVEMVPLACCVAARLCAEGGGSRQYTAAARAVDAAALGLPVAPEHASTLLAWLPPSGSGRLTFTAQVVRGTGAEHARFKVATDSCGFTYEEEETMGAEVPAPAPAALAWAVETVGGALHPAALFAAAAAVLKGRLAAYAEATAAQGSGGEFLLPRETPTVGELLVAHLRRDAAVVFAGYARVTPADAASGLRVHVSMAGDADPWSAVAAAARAAAAEVVALQAAWRRAALLCTALAPHEEACPYAQLLSVH